MRVNTSLLGWGVFLVALGAVPLAASQGVITEDAVRGWWRLWPLLLIAGGVSLILRGSALGAIAGLVAAAGFGVMVGGALTGGFGGLSAVACGDDQGTTAFPAATGVLREGGSVDLELNCGELDVQVGEGSTWRLTGSSDDGRPPEIADGADRLGIRSSSDRPSFGFGRARDVWALTLPTAAVDLSFEVNAARVTLGLDGATLDRLDVGANASDVRAELTGAQAVSGMDIEVNAGSATLVLPERSMEGRVSVNAGTIRLCAAEGTALRIRTNDNVTASNNFEARGLRRSGDAWETEAFSAADAQIVLDAEANAGSIELNPEEGCDG
jgi:hypothetical protein